MLFPLAGKSQFAPAAGQPGSTAIKKDSSAIIAWATGCKVTRGLQDISNSASGYANVGDSSSAIGAADGVNVVSLGDGGRAVLTFQQAIKNLAGPDFCVFENSFDPGFLELAFVEVSSDGINFTRFPATCNVQNTVQIGPFDTTSDPAKINNLAGKYIGGYGVPFDLQELQGISGLDINAITHVKIIDVVGCIQTQYATRDQNNNIINDPWATPFGSGGFDLDAVGVINQVPAGIEMLSPLDDHLNIFPTVTNADINILLDRPARLNVMLYDLQGKIISECEINGRQGIIPMKDLPPSIYFLKVAAGEKGKIIKVVRMN
jgi:hypothetical protein